MFGRFETGDSAYAKRKQEEAAAKEALAAPEKLRGEMMDKALDIIIGETEGEDNIQQAIMGYLELKMRLSENSRLNSGTERVHTTQDDNLELKSLKKIAGLLAQFDTIDNSVLSRSFMEELVGKLEKDNIMTFPEQIVDHEDPEEPTPAQQQKVA